MFEHEQVVVHRGTRSGLPVIVAIRSTTPGPALGGCRLAVHPHWTDGLTDALRLSTAMTAKCATAGAGLVLSDVDPPGSPWPKNYPRPCSPRRRR